MMHVPALVPDRYSERGGQLGEGFEGHRSGLVGFGLLCSGGYGGFGYGFRSFRFGGHWFIGGSRGRGLGLFRWHGELDVRGG